MKAAVIVFPAATSDRDTKVCLEQSTGKPVHMVWHGDTEIPDVDLIVLPGGFSYGDYLRCGAMASHSPIMKEVKSRAKQGVHVLGICNGFQILCESGLLPGVLMRNAGLKFICKDVDLRVENDTTPFTRGYGKGQAVRIPVSHHDGNYFADDAALEKLEDEGRVAFRYLANPNGSRADIAGILNDKGNVLGMMPHPERLADAQLGGTDGRPMFDALTEALS